MGGLNSASRRRTLPNAQREALQLGDRSRTIYSTAQNENSLKNAWKTSNYPMVFHRAGSGVPPTVQILSSLWRKPLHLFFRAFSRVVFIFFPPGCAAQCRLPPRPAAPWATAPDSPQGGPAGRVVPPRAKPRTRQRPRFGGCFLPCRPAPPRPLPSALQLSNRTL